MKQVFKASLFLCALLSLASAQSCTLTTGEDGTQTSDCPSLNICIEGQCVHKPLFPLEPIEIGGLILVVFITGLASSGGNGGGTILTPILLIFFHYSESNAIMIVYSMIFGGAIGNFINTGTKRNPKTGKPYLNWDLALICMPPMLLGTSLGIILNRVVAPIVVVVGLVALTLYTLTRVSSKARSEYAKESANRREETRREEKLLAEEGLLNSFSESTDIDQSFEEPGESAEEENRLFPPIKVAKVLGILFFMVLLALFRGTLNFGSIIGLPYCGVGYWLCLLVGVIVCLLLWFYNQRQIRANIKLKQSLRYSFVREDEFQIKDQHIGKLLMLSLLAGILAGMFGIGGGTVMSPTLLGLGIKAQALSATSGFFVLQTSFISLIAAILYGEIPLTVMGFFLVTSCIGAFGVSWGINKLVKRYKRPSIILFSLLFVFALSLVATPTYEFIKNAHNMKNLLIFNDVCK